MLGLITAGAVGYVLGTKAGRERYEQIVGATRKVAGSQTVQSVVGVVEGRLDAIRHRT